MAESGVMILAAREKHEIGEVLRPTRIVIAGEDVELQPIRIVRECSKEEYLREHPDQVQPPMRPFFYEIHTD
jgi:hypothetical protein